MGDLDRLGPASDVYSLGATLYCLLTGKTPFEGDDVGAVLAKVQRGDFQPPSQVNGEVPATLEAICLKAMAVTPEDRYASALALADAIERWLADEPLSGYQDVVFTVSNDGRFTSLNPAFEARYGWSRAEWLGKPFAGIIHPDDLPSACRCFIGTHERRRRSLPHAYSRSRASMSDEFTCILQVLRERSSG